MNTETQLWVGSINGLHVVFDSTLQKNHSRWIFVLTINNGPAFYRRSHARATAKTLRSSHPERESYIERYLSWRGALDDQSLKQIFLLLSQKDIELEAEIAATRALNSRYLGKGADSDRVLNEPTGREPLRQTHCISCFTPLSSYLHLACDSCSLLVCHKCGACGCGYHRNYSSQSHVDPDENKDDEYEARQIRLEKGDYSASISRSNNDGWFYSDADSE